MTRIYDINAHSVYWDKNSDKLRTFSVKKFCPKVLSQISCLLLLASTTLSNPFSLNNWTRIDICHTYMVCWATNWYALREGCTHSLISQKTSVTDGTVVVPANSFLGAFPSQGRFQPNKHQGCNKNSDLISSLIKHRKCENFSVWHRRFWGGTNTRNGRIRFDWMHKK